MPLSTTATSTIQPGKSQSYQPQDWPSPSKRRNMRKRHLLLGLVVSITSFLIWNPLLGGDRSASAQQSCCLGGQTDPHNECVGGQCQQVSGCGTNVDCTTCSCDPDGSKQYVCVQSGG